MQYLGKLRLHTAGPLILAREDRHPGTYFSTLQVPVFIITQNFTHKSYSLWQQSKGSVTKSSFSSEGDHLTTNKTTINNVLYSYQLETMNLCLCYHRYQFNDFLTSN